MIPLLVNLLVVVLIFAIVYYAMTLLPIPQPFHNIILIILLLILVIYLVSVLLPYPWPRGRAP
jgi:hypothetical protein